VRLTPRTSVVAALPVWIPILRAQESWAAPHSRANAVNKRRTDLSRAASVNMGHAAAAALGQRTAGEDQEPAAAFHRDWDE
jgi:hypothetical protein